MTDSTSQTNSADDMLAIDRTSTAARAFHDLLVERGYPSINEFIVDVLRDDRSKKREAKLRSIGGRMFPDGPPERGEKE